MRWREAYAVVATVGGAEGEFAGGAPFGRDDTVVVVEGFVDGDDDGEVIVDGEGGAGGIVLFGFVVALQ